MEEDTSKTSRWQIESRLPRKRVLAFVLGVGILFWYGLLPLIGANVHTLNPGPLTSAHAPLEKDCRSCHITPGVAVPDSACLACHEMEAHPKDVSLPKWNPHHGRTESRCIDCHIEHHGKQSLTARQSKLCTDCHASIKTLIPESTIQDVLSWQKHPEFLVGTPPVSIKNNPIDSSSIKLNHAVHLKTNLRSTTGTETLQCQSCHELSSDRKTIKPITFETHCHRCHSLGFDEKIQTEAPHESPDVVFNFIYSEFAKRSLQETKKEDSETRVIPGQDIRSKKELEAKRRAVEEASRAAENLIFTKTGCFLCHMTEKSESIATKDDGVLYSSFKVAKPEIPHTWFDKAGFDHGAHQDMTCESCHGSAKTSKETKDVLLPAVHSCQNCHNGTSASVKSECIDCHNYHDQLPLPKEKQRSMEEILNR